MNVFPWVIIFWRHRLVTCKRYIFYNSKTNKTYVYVQWLKVLTDIPWVEVLTGDGYATPGVKGRIKQYPNPPPLFILNWQSIPEAWASSVLALFLEPLAPDTEGPGSASSSSSVSSVSPGRCKFSMWKSKLACPVLGFLTTWAILRN